MTDEEKQQVEIYGKKLSGDESALDLAKLARVEYLKQKMRPRLAASIGDLGDNVTDITRGLVLGEAIRQGLVSDQTIVSGYKAYVQSLLDGYGGPQAILTVLQGNTDGLQSELMEGYYIAKGQIDACTTVEAVSAIDLPGEPEPAGP